MTGALSASITSGLLSGFRLIAVSIPSLELTSLADAGQICEFFAVMAHAAKIIDAFGGPAAAAVALGLPLTTVRSWAVSGFVPARQQAPVLAAARAAGIRLGPADFFLPELSTDTEARLIRVVADLARAARAQQRSAAALAKLLEPLEAVLPGR